MKIVVSSHQGNLYNEEVDYVVVHSDSDGEFAIMQNHIPVVSVIDEGYVKLVRDKDEFYVVIVNGILQGILCWGVAVGINQTVKQLGKNE